MKKREMEHMQRWREMRGVIPIYNPSYNVLFFVIVISILYFRHVLSINGNTLTSTESLTIYSNRTIISLGDDFELGFFNPAASLRDSDNWYLGIWYKKIPVRTYVWVANRDNPLPNSAGTLKISGINLVLLNPSNMPVWSTNLSGAVTSPVIAELLPSGNFVLKDSKTNGQYGILWQSFDYPTDTLLPHMKLGLDLKTGNNRILRSWKNTYNPSRGYYWFKLEIRGLPEFFLWKDESLLLRSGPWDGTRFNGIPEMQRWQYVDIVNNFTENKDEVAYTYRVTTPNVYSRLTLNTDGFLQLFTWTPITQEWNIFWISSGDDCNPYGRCGLYAYCDTNTSPMCNCIKGFEPRNLQEWVVEDGLSECLRKTKLSCNGDEFLQLRNMKLPDTTGVIVDRRIGLKECEERCNRNCNCTAFANTDIQNGGSGCVIWTGMLRDIRKYASAGQDLYVRLAAVDLEEAKNKNGKRKDMNVGKIIGLTVAGGTLLLLLSFLIFFFWKRKHHQASAFAGHTEDLEMPLLEYDVVAMATNDFSSCNKLGEGGFGTVYKGRLRGGEEIAVKRLSEVSSQGRTEFETEMKLIAKLQHINLIRLLGCYADAEEKMLVYEYLENRSLDYFIFDKTKSSMLNWKKRFDIINGIARGLLYLHQDSRCRVIHRDLKASNILLDKNMIPKISDFGMARIFAGNQEEASTRRIVGTYGYMAPEYAMDGVYSIKSDVFSFGVLLLEIISGKKNRGFYDSDKDRNLLSYTWRNWNEGNGLEIVDPVIADSSPSTYRPHEILRCIQIALLCVQDYAEDRPTTSSVVMMLGSEKAEVPQPQPPGYCLVATTSESGSSSSSSSNDWTLNDVTVTAIEGR